MCSPLSAADGERGRGGGVEVSGLVKGLMGGWSYSGRGGSDDGSFRDGEIWGEGFKETLCDPDLVSQKKSTSRRKPRTGLSLNETSSSYKVSRLRGT